MQIPRFTLARPQSQGNLLCVGVQLIDDVFEFVELLACFAELSGCGEALVVGEVFAGFRDQGVEVGGWLRCASGSYCCRLCLLRVRGGERRGLAAEQGLQRSLEGWAVGQAVLQREHNEAKLGHGALLGLQVDGLGVQERAA